MKHILTVQCGSEEHKVIDCDQPRKPREGENCHNCGSPDHYGTYRSVNFDSRLISQARIAMKRGSHAKTPGSATTVLRSDMQLETALNHDRAERDEMGQADSGTLVRLLILQETRLSGILSREHQKHYRSARKLANIANLRNIPRSHSSRYRHIS